MKVKYVTNKTCAPYCFCLNSKGAFSDLKPAVLFSFWANDILSRLHSGRKGQAGLLKMFRCTEAYLVLKVHVGKMFHFFLAFFIQANVLVILWIMHLACQSRNGTCQHTMFQEALTYVCDQPTHKHGFPFL